MFDPTNLQNYLRYLLFIHLKLSI